MDVICKKCNVRFYAQDHYKGAGRTVCDSCKKKRYDEYHIKYLIAIRGSHIPRVAKLKRDLLRGDKISDLHGFKSHRSLTSAIHSLKSDGLNIIKTTTYQLG